MKKPQLFIEEDDGSIHKIGTKYSVFDIDAFNNVDYRVSDEIQKLVVIYEPMIVYRLIEYIRLTVHNEIVINHKFFASI